MWTERYHFCQRKVGRPVGSARVLVKKGRSAVTIKGGHSEDERALCRSLHITQPNIILFFSATDFNDSVGLQEQQRIIEGLVAGIITFVVSIRFLIPLVFMSGFLALVARQLRNNVKWSVQWMKVTAQKAVLAASAEELAYDKQMREENLADAFCRIAANSGKKTVSLAELGPLIERISNKQNFVVQLADLLKIEASMVELDYRAFRGFCSLLSVLLR